MRNLKRLLTMVMAIAMMMSLMVVGAGATAFKDDKDITHKDAVEKMVSLSIINGRDNGNYDPTGIVTRAEMAKMICIAMNGGNDPKLSSSSVVTSTFTDTKGHWAEGYIEYCVNMGVAAGLGDKTFGPDQKVTASQAAKMLLVALGYDAAFEKFTGATWALNSNKVAMQKGLYDEIQGIDPNAPMTRDAAAQMIYNFCYANMVKYEFGITGDVKGSVTGVKQAIDVKVMVNGSERYETILTKYYKLVSVKGTLVEINYDSKKKEYGYVISYEGLDKDKKPVTKTDTFYTTAKHADKIGLKVELLFKDKNNDGYNRTDDSVYDINLDDSAIVAKGNMTDFDKYDLGKSTLKFNGTTYDLDKGEAKLTGMYGFNGTAAELVMLPDSADHKTGDAKIYTYNTDSKGAFTSVKAVLNTPYTINLLDNDNNGKIDSFVVVPFTVQKVTYVASDSITFTGQGCKLDNTSFDGKANVYKKDITAYEGIAKDDIVAYYDSANTAERTATAVKMDLKSGVASEIRADKKQVKIDGTWYDMMTSTSIKAGDKVNFAAVGTNIYYTKVTEAEATSRNVLGVYDFDNSPASSFNKKPVKLKVIFGIDGTKKDVTIAKVDDKKVVMSGAKSDETTILDASIYMGKMYSYKVNSDGEYELTTLTGKQATGENLAGHDNYTGETKYFDKKIGGFELADNASVLVISTKEKDAKKYTGAEIKRNYGEKTQFGSKAYALVDETNSFNYATVATIVTDDNMPKMTSGLKYGYLLSNPSTSRVNGKDYRNFSVWTNEGKKALKEDETASFATGMAKGGFITYNVVDATTDKENILVKDVAVADIRVGYVSGWDDVKKDRIQFNDKDQYDVDKDTQIFNINVKDVAGVEGNAIVVGNTTTKTNNAYYIVNPDKTKVDMVVVDLSGLVDAKGMKTVYASSDVAATVAAVNSELNTAGIQGVRVAGDFTTTSAITVPEGKTLMLDGNVTTTGNVTLAKNAQLVVNGKVTMSGANAVDATATISGDGTLTVGALPNANNFSNVAVKNVVINGAYAPTGDVTIATTQSLTVDSFTVAADKALTVNGNLVVKDTMTMTAKTTGTTTMVVNGTATLNAAKDKLALNSADITGTGTLTITTADKDATVANLKVSNLVVSGAFAPAAKWDIAATQKVTVNGDLTVAADSIVAGTLTVTGKVTATGKLSVAGTATIKGDISGAAGVETTVATAVLNTEGGVEKIVANAGTINATAATAKAIAEVVANAGTINTAANVTITKVTANTATINAKGVITELNNGAAGIVNAENTITEVKTNNATGVVNVKADLSITTLTASAGKIVVAEGKTLTVTNAAATSLIQKITAEKAGAKLILGAASITDDYVTTAGAKFFYKDKNEMGTVKIAKDTYTWTAEPTTTGWVAVNTAKP